MFKLASFFGILAFFISSGVSGFALPRFTQSPGDYIIMPLFGYIMIILAAQLAARFVSQNQK